MTYDYAVAALHGDDVCEDDIDKMVGWLNHKAREGYRMHATAEFYGGVLIFMEATGASDVATGQGVPDVPVLRDVDPG